jgi:mannitol-1-phosphate/altronate dehydrogenase
MAGRRRAVSAVVLEDTFAAGRPKFEEVGVLFTERVHDWELYKPRMLNATHSCLEERDTFLP